MEYTRRDFLFFIAKSAAAATVAGGALHSLSSLASGTGGDGTQEYDISKYYWGYGIDLEKCIGCGRCVNACKIENDVPDYPFFFRTWVERYVVYDNRKVVVDRFTEYKSKKLVVDSPNGGKDSFPEIKNKKGIDKTFFVPKLCNHCETSPCVQVCPVGATFVSRDGVVLIDHSLCVGCRYCIQACPYGTRYFSPKYKCADKCTLCYHRITKGLAPACVNICPTGTRMFGNLKNPNSVVSRFIRENKVQVLKPHIGTRPKCFYKNMDKEVR